MFANLLQKKEWFDNLYQEAILEVKKQDNLRYVIHRCILEEISKEDIILCNRELLYKDLQEIRLPFYVFYTKNPKSIGVKITDIVYKIHKVPIILKCVDPGLHYDIYVNGSIITELHSADLLLPLQIMPPTLSITWLDIDFKLIPPELHLIDVYRKLAIPQSNSEYEELEIIEKKLLSLCPVKFSTVVSGGKPNANDKVYKLKKTIQNIIRDFITAQNAFAVQNNVESQNNVEQILIGAGAMSIVESINKTFDIVDFIEVISNSHINVTVEWWRQKIAHYTDFNIIVKNQNINVLFDHRLQKYTIYMQFTEAKKQIQRPLVHIYTSAQYDQIPVIYIKNVKIAIATLPTLLRFTLINCWNIRKMQADKHLDDETANLIIKNLNNTFDTLSQNKFLIDNSHTCDFIGKYSDDNISYKITTLLKRRKFMKDSAPYKPY
jgi:hypothetical protein